MAQENATLSVILLATTPTTSIAKWSETSFRRPLQARVNTFWAGSWSRIDLSRRYRCSWRLSMRRNEKGRILRNPRRLGSTRPRKSTTTLTSISSHLCLSILSRTSSHSSRTCSSSTYLHRDSIAIPSRSLNSASACSSTTTLSSTSSRSSSASERMRSWGSTCRWMLIFSTIYRHRLMSSGLPCWRLGARPKYSSSTSANLGSSSCLTSSSLKCSPRVAQSLLDSECLLWSATFRHSTLATASSKTSRESSTPVSCTTRCRRRASEASRPSSTSCSGRDLTWLSSSATGSKDRCNSSSSSRLALTFRTWF